MSGDRQTPSLGLPPDDPAALESFPRRELAPSLQLFRVVRRGHGPWWFSNSMQGRFDLPPPLGTCYLATDELAALLEALGPSRQGGAVSTDFLAQRALRCLRLPRSRQGADTISRRATGFGVTAEIGNIVSYELPQRWAARWHAAGFEAVVYWLRHDPARSEGVALFGPAGERKSWRRGRAQRFSEKWIRRLESECGVRVLPVPRSDQLRFVDDESTTPHSGRS